MASFGEKPKLNVPILMISYRSKDKFFSFLERKLVVEVKNADCADFYNCLIVNPLLIAEDLALGSFRRVSAILVA